MNCGHQEFGGLVFDLNFFCSGPFAGMEGTIVPYGCEPAAICHSPELFRQREARAIRRARGCMERAREVLVEVNRPGFTGG